jgi:lipopolysaccharide assembly protein A
MSFLKTVFWVIILVAFLVFAINNWLPVSVRLWNGWLLDTKLPVLIGIAFILGFLPLYILHRISRYRLNRQIAKLESVSRPAPLDISRVDDVPASAMPGASA